MNRLLNILRAILLVIAVMALVVGAVWALLPDWVHRFDAAVVRGYVSLATIQLERARGEAGTDPDRAIAEYASFLSGLQDIRKGDRLAPFKRQAFEELVHSLSELERYPQALEWAERWVSFDPNDLVAQTRRIEILARSREESAEALRLAEQLFERVPEVALVAHLYARLLWETGELGSAIFAYDKHLGLQPAPQVKPWSVFWNTGNGFGGRQTASLEPRAGADGVLRINGRLPAGVRALRIDPPQGMRLWIADPRLHWPATGRSELHLLTLSLGLHQMKQQGSLLVSLPEATDPYFYWSLPGGPTSQAGPVELLFNVGPDLPAWFLELVREDQAQRLRDDLERGGQPGVLEAWDRMWAISELRRRWEAPPRRLPQALSDASPRMSGVTP